VGNAGGTGFDEELYLWICNCKTFFFFLKVWFSVAWVEGTHSVLGKRKLFARIIILPWLLKRVNYQP